MSECAGKGVSAVNERDRGEFPGVDFTLGIDFGEIPYGTCTICRDYIWEGEVDQEEAFFEAFDPRPPHHNRCLGDFLRTGELLMEYYLGLLPPLI